MNYKTIKAGQRIKGGVNAKNISEDLKQKEKRKNNNIAETDGKNRQYIINLILENIKAGKTEEQALEIAINDEVAKKFEYLENNGLNKKECFRNWSRGYASSKNKKNKNFVR